MEQTLKNLAKAFIGESQARNRYTFYAKTAKKEGYEQISGVFLETANHEKEHAHQLFKLLQTLNKAQAKELAVEAAVPLVYKDTAANLEAAIAGERYETNEMYPEFANMAQQEGFTDIATRLRAIAQAEAHHQQRYQKLLVQLEAGTVFAKEKDVYWTCRECGYTHFGKQAPVKCPSCDHEQSYYQIQCENY